MDAREKRCRVFLFVLNAWFLARMVLPVVELHGHDVWCQPDAQSLSRVVWDPRNMRVAAMLSGVLVLAPSSLSRRKVADLLHCLDHLCVAVTLFFHNDAVEFAEDVGLTATAHIMFACFVCNRLWWVCSTCSRRSRTFFASGSRIRWQRKTCK